MIGGGLKIPLFPLRLLIGSFMAYSLAGGNIPHVPFESPRNNLLRFLFFSPSEGISSFPFQYRLIGLMVYYPLRPSGRLRIRSTSRASMRVRCALQYDPAGPPVKLLLGRVR